MRRITSFLCGALTAALLAMLMILPAAADAPDTWTDHAEDTSWYTAYTDSTSYEVATPERLASVAKLVNEGYGSGEKTYPDFSDKTIVIKADLDLSGHDWVPIGTPDHPFKGMIRAAGETTISGLTVTSASAVTEPSVKYYGLIGYGLGATVTNLKISGTITVSDSGDAVVGAAMAYAGINNTTVSEISKLSSSVTIQAAGGSAIIGGVVGESAGAKLSGCVNGVQVNQTISGGTIIVTGATDATVGGLVGKVAGDTIIAGNGGGGEGGEGGASSGPSRNNAALSVAAQTATVGGIVGTVSGGELSMTTRETNQSSNDEEYAKYIWSMGNIAVTPATSADVGGFIGSIVDEGVCDLQEAIFIRSISVKNNTGFTASVGGILGAQRGSGQSALINCKYTTGLTVKSGTSTLISESGTPKIEVSSTGTVFTGGIYGRADKLKVVTPMVGDETARATPNIGIQSGGFVGGIGGMYKADEAYTDGLATITSLRVQGTENNCSVGGAFGTVDGWSEFGLYAENLEVRSLSDGACVGGVAGTVAGEATDGTIHAVGNIKVTASGNGGRIGGFAGRNTGTLKNISLGDRTTVRCTGGSGCSVGGFVGTNEGTIDCCYSTAALETRTAEMNAVSTSLKNLSLGGLVGTNTGKVSNSYRDAEVSAYSRVMEDTLESAVGGLIGTNTGDVEKCYAACAVNAAEITRSPAYVGGLIGWMKGGSVENCYAAAGYAVAGNASNGTVGGFIGRRDVGAKATNCYAAAAVTDGNTKGGFFGSFGGNDADSVSGCVYLLDNGGKVNVGMSGAGAGTPSWTADKLTSFTGNDFAEQSSFTLWDFDNVWRVSHADGRMYSCPVLLRETDGSSLNYDIRWYTEDVDAAEFTVSDEADLSGLAMLVNGAIGKYGTVSFADKTVRVANAFNLQAGQWAPIGSDFVGTFDGADKLIDGLRGASLFAPLSAEATVNRVALEVLDISDDRNNTDVGAVTPVNNGTIDAAKVILTRCLSATGASGNTGGIAGTNNGTITSSQLTFDEGGSVSATGAAGGVAGRNNGTVTNPVYCFVGDSVFVSSAAESGSVGGVVGVNESGGTLSASGLTIARPLSATGVTGYVGGVAGQNAGTIESTTLTLNAAVFSTGAAGCAGGVAGQNTAVISGSAVQGTGTVNGAACAGGLAGRLTGSGAIDASAVRNITVRGTGKVGGAVGEANGTLTANAPNMKSLTVGGVSVTGDNAPDVGGVIGHANGVMAAGLTVSGLTLNAEKTDTVPLMAGGVAGLAENSILRDIAAQALAVNVTNADAADISVGGAAGKLLVTNGEENKTYKLSDADALGVYQGIFAARVVGLTMQATGAENAVGTKKAFTGGLVGLTDRGCVYDSSVSDSTMNVSGFAAICSGGAAGQATSAYLVNNTAGCGLDLSYGGAYDAGGFIGTISNATARFNRASAASAIKVRHNDAAMTGHIYVGGFAGRIDNTADWEVSDNSAAQPVSVICEYQNTSVYAGGFAGQIGGTKNTTEVSTCYATGGCTVRAKAYVYGGGFVGEAHSGTIDSCYASGNTLSVTAKDVYVGGFAGQIASDAMAGNCYAADGTVSATGSATANTGAFVGNSVGMITAAYASMGSVREVVTGTVNKARIEIYPEQTASLANHVRLTGFDFDSAARKWCYVSGRNANRPVLVALESWDSAPDFSFLRRQGLTSISAASAAQLGTAARLLNDASFAKLLTDGRTGRGDVTVTLTGNVNLAGKPWNPIVSLNSGDMLDGDGHTLSGLCGDAADYENCGLVQTNSGTIQNLTISGATVTAGTPAGIAAGTNAGTITNVTVTNSALTGTDDAGGVAGSNTGTITNCTVTNSVTVKGGNAGGIAGTNSGTIGNSTTNAAVQFLAVADGTVAGGAVGTNEGTLSQITSNATVKGTTVGGIAGVNEGGGVIESSVSNAAVTGSTAAGGVVGENRSGATVGAGTEKGDVVSKATVTAPTVGGIAGVNNGTVKNCDMVSANDQLKGGMTASGRIVAAGTPGTNCREYQCAAPKASPAARGFTDKVTVTLTTTTEGAAIYYTTNGEEPTGSSTLYAAPIELAVSTTIKAIAVKEGYVDSGTVSFAYAKQTPGGGGGGGAAPAPETEVRVSGSASSINLAVSVSGENAEVGTLTAEQVRSVGDAANITLDLTGLSKSVDMVTLLNKTVDAISASSAKGLEIRLTGGTVTLDEKTLELVANQSDSKTQLVLIVGKTAEEVMTPSQKAAVSRLNAVTALDLRLSAGTRAITDFGGGKAVISVPYALAAGQTGRGVTVWYVAADGALTEIPSTYADGMVTFTVTHFSSYAIAYDASRGEACPKDATCPISAFVDADAKEWYHAGVHWALENGAMNGVGDGKFAPNDASTRAQVVMMLWRLEGSPAYVGMSEYSDVDNEEWYGPAIRWASAEGIVNGYDDGTFAPNDAVTREQLAVMLYRYAQYKMLDVSANESADLPNYNDAQTVSEWALPAMRWAVGSGIINGMDGSLAPVDRASRAQLATMLMRFENIAK